MLINIKTPDGMIEINDTVELNELENWRREVVKNINYFYNDINLKAPNSPVEQQTAQQATSIPDRITSKQASLLQALGYDGDFNISMSEANQLIKKLKTSNNWR